MTSLNSSTFSSKRYLALLGGVTLGVVFLLGAISYFGLRNGLLDFAFSDLFQYQLSKLQSQRHADIVFVGDSSLGNAIDAEYFSKQTGMFAVNLALTGAYGYGGSYNMLRRALDRWHPRVVVIMQTPDMMTRSQVHEGFIHTAITAEDIFTAPLKEVLTVLGNVDMIISMVRRTLKAYVPTNSRIVGDYILQSAPLSSQVKRAAVSGKERSSDLDQAQLYYLSKIAQICHDSGIKCMYAHGPWLEGLCNRSRQYLTAASSAISQTGMIMLLGTPVCVPEQDIGDSLDHIHPARKRDYSDIYLGKLVVAGVVERP